MTTQPAHTYTEARAAAEGVSYEVTIERLQADDNPYVYEYNKMFKLAMDLRVHLINPAKPVSRTFVGFEYCDRKGYSHSGTAELYSYKSRGECGPYTLRPTVFYSEKFGHFYCDEKPEWMA